MVMDTQEKIREIKKQFRLFMNGVVSQSMREKGLDYKLNFGILVVAVYFNSICFCKF